MLGELQLSAAARQTACLSPWRRWEPRPLQHACVRGSAMRSARALDCDSSACAVRACSLRTTRRSVCAAPTRTPRAPCPALLTRRLATSRRCVRGGWVRTNGGGSVCCSGLGRQWKLLTGWQGNWLLRCTHAIDGAHGRHTFACMHAVHAVHASRGWLTGLYEAVHPRLTLACCLAFRWHLLWMCRPRPRPAPRSSMARTRRMRCRGWRLPPTRRSW